MLVHVWPLLHPCHLHGKNFLRWSQEDKRQMGQPRDMQSEAEPYWPTHRLKGIQNNFKAMNFGVVCYKGIGDWCDMFLIYLHGAVRKALDKGAEFWILIIILPLPGWLYASYWLFKSSVYPHHWNSCTEAEAAGIVLFTSEYIFLMWEYHQVGIWVKFLK